MEPRGIPVNAVQPGAISTANPESSATGLARHAFSYLKATQETSSGFFSSAFQQPVDWFFYSMEETYEQCLHS